MVWGFILGMASLYGLDENDQLVQSMIQNDLIDSFLDETHAFEANQKPEASSS